MVIYRKPTHTDLLQSQPPTCHQTWDNLLLNEKSTWHLLTRKPTGGTPTSASVPLRRIITQGSFKEYLENKIALASRIHPVTENTRGSCVSPMWKGTKWELTENLQTLGCNCGLQIQQYTQSILTRVKTDQSVTTSGVIYRIPCEYGQMYVCRGNIQNHPWKNKRSRAQEISEERRH